MTFCKVAKNLEEQRFIWYKGQTFLMTTTVKAKEPSGVVASSVFVPGSSKLEAVLWLSILKSDPILYKAKCFRGAYLAFSNKNACTLTSLLPLACVVSANIPGPACIYLLGLVILRKISGACTQ